MPAYFSASFTLEKQFPIFLKVYSLKNNKAMKQINQLRDESLQ